MTLGMLPYLLAFVLLVIGLYAIVAKRNVIKVIVGLLIVDYAANLLLILVGYRGNAEGAPVAPILTAEATAENVTALAQSAVDPLPQALILTSIVIGLSVTALVVALAIRLYDRHGTFDTGRMRNLRG